MNRKALLQLIAGLSAAVISTSAHAQFAGPKVKDAKPGEIRVIVTAAIREPLDAVKDQAAASVGHPLVVEYGSARGNLRDEILGGQDFEVAMLLPDVNEEILAQGKTLPGAFEIARVPVAVGLRGTAPNIDVSTPAKLKEAMLKAKSVKYSPTGAALDTVKKVIGTLGIADAIHDSSKLKDPVELGPDEYEIDLYPISEIIPNKNLKNLGPVTHELQVPVVIAAVIGKNASDPKAARALIKFLQSSAIDPALKADGMQKGMPDSHKAH